MLVFENDGDGDELDASSWSLLEQLLLARRRMSIPESLDEMTVDIAVESMTKGDTEHFIRALFCDRNNSDREMNVDESVLGDVFDLCYGCPLFTERVISWAQRKDIIELDETCNAVSLNYDKSALTLTNTAPHSLNEELLEVINIIPHSQLDALKVASCLGEKAIVCFVSLSGYCIDSYCFF